MTELIWSFSPWLAFLLAARFGSLYVAVAVGAAAAVVVTGRAVVRHRLHLLDVASLCYFVIIGGVLVIVHPGHLDFWSRYAQAGSHTALTLIVFGSILVGHPFTESYARERTPATIWHTAEFHAVNRRISTVWGLAFLVGTISLIAAGSVGERQVLLRIIIPFGTLFAAYQYTQKQSKLARDTTSAGAGPDPGGRSSHHAQAQRPSSPPPEVTASQSGHSDMPPESSPGSAERTDTP